MLVCNECGQEKPDNEVQLGICDYCFKHGAPKRNTTSFTPRPLNGGTNERPTATTYTPPEPTEIVLTTSIDVPNRKIECVISIVAAEAAIGMNVFRDIANNWRDFVGGRSHSSQNSLREARLACLEQLKREAAAIGADAVIAVDLDYNELSTSAGGGILFVAASGTAVKLAPSDEIKPR